MENYLYLDFNTFKNPGNISFFDEPVLQGRPFARPLLQLRSRDRSPDVSSHGLMGNVYLHHHDGDVEPGPLLLQFLPKSAQFVVMERSLSVGYVTDVTSAIDVAPAALDQDLSERNLLHIRQFSALPANRESMPGMWFVLAVEPNLFGKPLKSGTQESRFIRLKLDQGELAALEQKEEMIAYLGDDAPDSQLCVQPFRRVPTDAPLDSQAHSVTLSTSQVEQPCRL